MQQMGIHRSGAGGGEGGIGLLRSVFPDPLRFSLRDADHELEGVPELLSGTVVFGLTNTRIALLGRAPMVGSLTNRNAAYAAERYAHAVVLQPYSSITKTT